MKRHKNVFVTNALVNVIVQSGEQHTTQTALQNMRTTIIVGLNKVTLKSMNYVPACLQQSINECGAESMKTCFD